MNNIKKYPVTYTLLALCILTYIGTTLLFSMDMNAMQGLACGGFNPYYVQVTHQYYRLITANFIHFGLMHIVVNCYSMYNLSCFVEYLMGSKKYLIVILASMLSTTGLPYIAYLLLGIGVHTVSGGISGVIFGIIGAIGALYLFYPTQLRDIYFFYCTDNIFIRSCKWHDWRICFSLYYSLYYKKKKTEVLL